MRGPRGRAAPRERNPPMASPLPPDDTEAARGPLGRLRALSGTQRALILYALALLFGVLIVPLLIWLVGNRVLGPYTQGQNTHAGALALLQDFFVGLAHGSAVFWAVALGPLLIVLLLQLFLRGLRALPRAGHG
jgi:hypothetical protein